MNQAVTDSPFHSLGKNTEYMKKHMAEMKARFKK